MEPYLHKVQYYETDQMGIVHHSNYIRWMEEARVAFLEELGWGMDRLEGLGVSSPVLQVRCSYHKPVRFAQTVRILLTVKEYRGARVVIGYRMEEAATGALACSGESEHCFVNEKGRPLRLRTALPEFEAALKAACSPEPGPPAGAP